MFIILINSYVPIDDIETYMSDSNDLVNTSRESHKRN